MSYEDLQPKRPQQVALSFSGGGFRAAVYSLGCLSYINRIHLGGQKLTDLVSFISSASGGTITNLTYTASRRNGVTFEKYFSDLFSKINNQALADRVFALMVDDDKWNTRPVKSRNLINAFAMVYDELLFGGETFSTIASVGGSPQAICANATEFDNGMLFRFQNEGVFGNKFLYATKEAMHTVNKIKLGDVLAASSCFPVGFEPLMYPKDFAYADLTTEALEQALVQDSRFSPAKEQSEDAKPISFGLMDGGIDDNQGIDSFIRAEDRLQNKNGFGYDLYISCDVSSNYTSGYDFPEEKQKGLFHHVSVMQVVLLIVFVFGLALAGGLIPVWQHFSFALLGVSGLALLLVLFAALALRSIKIKGERNHSTFISLLFQKGKMFLQLRLSALIQMLTARGTSAGYLASTVFLKKIRRISYDRLFEKVSFLKKGDVTYLKHWNEFALQNAIYLLTPKNDAQRITDLKNEPWFTSLPDMAAEMEPTGALQNVAKLAAEMDTTLWFDKYHLADKRPSALVATGQFTTCYNLLRYSLRFDTTDAFWNAAQADLVADWKKFKQDPYWMVP